MTAAMGSVEEVAEYRMALPEEKVLAAELERTRRMLEGRRKETRR